MSEVKVSTKYQILGIPVINGSVPRILMTRIPRNLSLRDVKKVYVGE